MNGHKAILPFILQYFLLIYGIENILRKKNNIKSNGNSGFINQTLNIPNTAMKHAQINNKQ